MSGVRVLRGSTPVSRGHGCDPAPCGHVALSPRLRACADALPVRYHRLIEVGCDHAQLCVGQLLQNRCQEALALDILPGPLARAEEAFRAYGLSAQASCKLSDGLEAADLRAGDCLALAGLGGLEIHDILWRSANKIISFAKDKDFAKDRGALPLRIVIQAQKSVEVLRLFLAACGFKALPEILAESGNHLYVVQTYEIGKTLAEKMPSYIEATADACCRFCGAETETGAETRKMAPRDVIEPARLYLEPSAAAWLSSLRETCGLSLADLLIGPWLSAKKRNHSPLTEVEERYVKARCRLFCRVEVYDAVLPAVGKIRPVFSELKANLADFGIDCQAIACGETL